MHYSSIFVVFFFASLFIFTSEAVDLLDAFCDCTEDECCNLSDLNLNLVNNINTGSNEFEIVSPLFGNYSAAYAVAGISKQNINLFAFSAINCVDSIALLFDQTSDSTTPLAEVALTQVDATTCQINFDFEISEADLRKTLDLVIAFRDVAIGGTNLVVQLLDSIVPFTLPTHQWIVQETQGDDAVVTMSLNIQINENSAHEEACVTNQERYFRFLPAVDAPRDAEACTFLIDGIQTFDNGERIQLDYTFEQEDYTECYRQTPQNIGQSIVYTFEVVPQIEGCEYFADYPSFIFTATLSNQLDFNQTANVNQAVLRTLASSIRLVPCEGTENEVNSLVPIARIEFDIQIDTAYGTPTSAVNILTSTMQDVGFGLVTSEGMPTNAFTYSSLPDGNTRASGTLRSNECLFVDTVHSGSPASQQNLLSCSIEYLPPLDLEVNIIYNDGFVEVADLIGTGREISFESDSLTECAGIIIPSNDVTQVYQAQLTMKDYNDRTSSLNINNPIVLQVDLTNVDLVTETGVSVVIEDVVVSFDDEFRRTFTQDDKEALMKVISSSYYDDAVYCRKFDPEDDVCSRFLDVESETGNWNTRYQTLWDAGVSGLFRTDPSGGRSYRGCTPHLQSSSDSFVFTPSEWIFGNFPRSTGVMQVIVTAYLRSCTISSSGGGPNLRRLQSTDVQVVRLNASTTITLELPTSVVCNPGGEGGGNGTVTTIVRHHSDETLFIVAIVLLSIVLALLLLFSLFGVGIIGRMYSAAKSKVEDRI